MVKSILSLKKEKNFLNDGRIAKWPNAADCKSVPSGSMVQIHLLPPFQILPRSQVVRHQTLTLTCVGSNPAIPAKYDPLAQSVEQLPFKQWVWSSNLQRVTKKEISPRGYLFFDTRGDSKI